MPHYLLSTEARFSAAHTLPGVADCDRMHGHTWRVRVTVRIEASELEERGMGPDLRALETATRGSVEDLEHRYLNDLEPFHAHPPTAERLAFVIAERMRTRLADFAAAVRVDEIEVWELPEYRVSYRPA